MSRCAVIFGQFGVVADPMNLPNFQRRLAAAGIESILIEHTDSQKAYDFLHRYNGKIALIGASLGAMSAVVFAGYLSPREVDFVGGFQPSDYDPSGHSVNIPLYHQGEDVPYDVIVRAIEVPVNVREALCFRNPQVAVTGGLGHAAYLVKDAARTKCETIERLDVHPGDFGQAQDIMLARAVSALK